VEKKENEKEKTSLELPKLQLAHNFNFISMH